MPARTASSTDPATGIVYETEDDGASGFYRFLPDDADNLSAGGRLQMLAVKGRPNYDTRTGQPQPTDASPQEVIEEGMQGADGNMDANGLKPGATPAGKLDELKENLGELGGQEK